MATRYVTLKDSNGDTIYPQSVIAQVANGEITTGLLADGAVTSDKIDWATFPFKYLESASTSITIGAGQALTYALVDYVTVPSGYTIISITPYITGPNSTADALVKTMGQNSSLAQVDYAIGITNMSTSSRTWSFKIGVWCARSNIL